MTTLPLTLAMIALSPAQNANTSSADFNNDGVVNAADLIAITSNYGIACNGECPTDLNNDGVTNQSDLLVLMQSWGPVQGWVDPNATIQQSVNNSDDNQTNQQDMSWQGQGPVLFDAILYDQDTRLFSHGGYARWHNAEEYNQGEFAQAWASSNNVATQPMVYGGVDWDHNNDLTEEDKANFVIWMDETIPADYSGPICLDLEGQSWSMFETPSQSIMDVVLDRYIEQLEFAKSLRPNAKIGFWGLPKKSHTNPANQIASIQRLLDASTAIFPDVYENNIGGNDASRLQLHIERAIEMVNGKVPVYAQTFARYRNINTGLRNAFFSQEEFIRDQVQSSLDAVWTDTDGVEHRVSGVSLWDAYSFVAAYTDGWSEMSMEERKEVWNDIDHTHVEFLTNMKVAVGVAFAAAQERLAQATAAEEAAAVQAAAVEEAARVAAAEKAASELKAERKRQRSRLVRRLNSERTKIRRASSTYRKSAKQYKSARNSYTKNRRSYKSARNSYKSALKTWRTKGRKLSSTARKAAWKKFASARNSYRSSVKSWRTNVKSWRVSAKSFSKQRSSYRSSRNAWRSTVKTWRAANKTWNKTATAASTLASK